MTTRRKLLAGAASLAAASLAAAGARKVYDVRRQPETRAAVLACPDYDEARLVEVLVEGIALFPEVVRRAFGKRVVLKPNLVEFHEEHPINTDARLLAATVEAFRKLGASEVLVAEGPGHHRDTELLLERTGLDRLLAEVGSRFVDLNLDRAVELTLPHDLTGLGRLKLGGTAVGADLLVSVAKLKTHHWVGATLTLKNLFGTVPGSVYGWPKNPLHWAGIEQSIIDIWSALSPGFGIVDGVVGMEGDGPIMGSARAVGAIVMGPQLPAVDATAARLMGIRADGLGYLGVASVLGGTIAPSRIELIGDSVAPVPFSLLPQFAHLRG
ncbi:MAG TPA: DUF362 domain-containing protein [Myxococcota bacterium]|nr:DUF362 domain-containing protein [Myxococcota bacterium]